MNNKKDNEKDDEKDDRPNHYKIEVTVSGDGRLEYKRTYINPKQGSPQAKPAPTILYNSANGEISVLLDGLGIDGKGIYGEEVWMKIAGIFEPGSDSVDIDFGCLVRQMIGDLRKLMVALPDQRQQKDIS